MKNDFAPDDLMAAISDDEEDGGGGGAGKGKARFYYLGNAALAVSVHCGAPDHPPTRPTLPTTPTQVALDADVAHRGAALAGAYAGFLATAKKAVVKINEVSGHADTDVVFVSRQTSRGAAHVAFFPSRSLSAFRRVDVLSSSPRCALRGRIFVISR